MSKTYVEINKLNDQIGNVIWAPKNGSWHWKILKDIKKGDKIYHFDTRASPSRFVGVSEVKKVAFEESIPEDSRYSRKYDTRYVVKLQNYKELPQPRLFNDAFKEKLSKLKYDDFKSPFNSNQQLNQIYCTELNDLLKGFIDRLANINQLDGGKNKMSKQKYRLESNTLEYTKLYNHYKRKGRIEFITFHPSYSYEEFIEGLTARTNEEGEVMYYIRDGIFKKICIKAIWSSIKDEHTEQELVSFEKAYQRFVENLDGGKGTFQTKTGKEFDVFLNQNENLKTFPREGTRETSYIVSKDRLSKLFTIKKDIQSPSEIREVIGGCNQSIFYGVYKEIKRLMSKDKVGEVNINSEDGYKQIKNFVIDYLKEGNNNHDKDSFLDAPNFVIIIDEINRGNIPKIFGELITLLEDNKRLGGTDPLLVKLPYSEEPFAVPSNLYLIGTMNTADRSIALIDLALRRRFSFKEMMPKLSDNSELYRIKKNELDSDEFVEFDNFRTAIEILNKEIKKEPELGRDKQIGHSYLFEIKTESVNDDIKRIWNDKILPLLEEYCYGNNALLSKLVNLTKIRDYSSITNKKYIKDMIQND